MSNYEKTLPLSELRILARMMAESGPANEPLNFITRYLARKDLLIREIDGATGFFPISREDLLLYYPRPFQDLVEKYAGELELAPHLLFGLIRTESYFVPDAGSRVGATGLTQLMPDTALDMATRIARRGGPDYRVDGAVDMRNPEINIHIGSFYLNYLFDLMGSPMSALLAYNGGLGRVRRWLAAAGLPEDLFLETIEYEETREYGRRVLSAAAMYGYLYYDLSLEEVVADIYR